MLDFNVTGMNIYVTVTTVPEGIPVNGSNNTFDYPILTTVSLLCMATTADGSPLTVTSYSSVTSYSWTATNCYNHTGGVQDSCFYSGGSTNNVTGFNLLAQDAGTVTCSATVDGISFTSDPLTLRISGEHS